MNEIKREWHVVESARRHLVIRHELQTIMLELPMNLASLMGSGVLMRAEATSSPGADEVLDEYGLPVIWYKLVRV
jgi:hypothetical protein